MTTLLLTVAVLGALPLLVCSIRRARAEGAWDPSTTFLVVVGLGLFVPMALGQATGTVGLQFDTFGNHVTVIPAALLRFQRYVTGALLFYGVFTFCRFATWRGTRPNRLALVALGLVLVGFCGNLARGLASHPDNRQLSIAGLLLAAVVLPRGRGARLGVALSALGVAVASDLMPLINSATAYRECRLDKCGVFGQLLLGVGTSENIVGLTLALSLPYVYLSFMGKTRLALCGFLLLTVIATGSRTAEIGAGAALLMIALVGRATREEQSRPAHKLLAGGVVLLGVGLAAIVPFVIREQGADSVSQRAVLWSAARQRLGATGWFGFGENGWAALYSQGVLPGTVTYGPHNLVLYATFAGGLIGLALVILLLAGVLCAGRGDRLGWAVGVLVMTPVLFTGIAEQPWEAFHLEWNTLPLLAALLAVAPTASNGNEPLPQTAGADAQARGREPIPSRA